MIDLGKAYQAKCQAALDAFRKSLNAEFERATAALEEAQQRCLKTIAEADEAFMLEAEARVSGAGLAIANTVRQFVGESPLEAPNENALAAMRAQDFPFVDPRLKSPDTGDSQFDQAAE